MAMKEFACQLNANEGENEIKWDPIEGQIK